MASPPAWSIGTSKRSILPFLILLSSLIGADWRGNNMPGPGQYQAGLSHKQGSPSWKY